MQQFSVRERLGVAAAATIVLMLGLGGWAYSRVGNDSSAITPRTANGAPAALEITAGGSSGAKPAVAGPASAASPTSASGAVAIIMVHVTGAVRNPGVYKFKDGDRICDAVHAAGGFKSSADQEALNLADTLQDADQICVPEKDTPQPTAAESATSGNSPRPRQRHNRLRPLIIPGTPHVNVIATAPVQPAADAPVAPVAPVIPVIATDAAPPPPVVVMHKRGRVVGRTLPKVETVTIDDSAGESPDAVLANAQGVPDAVVPQPISAGKSRSGKKSSGSSSKSGKANKFKNPGDGIVHLNSATAAQLEQLPGVGPAMSGRIVEYRTQIGKFTDISQMLDVKGIGDKKFAKMQPFLAL